MRVKHAAAMVIMGPIWLVFAVLSTFGMLAILIMGALSDTMNRWMTQCHKCNDTGITIRTKQLCSCPEGKRIGKIKFGEGGATFDYKETK